MSSHHPPRHCFRILEWHDAEQRVRGTFTEFRKRQPLSEIYDFTALDSADYLLFRSNPNGNHFNLFVRNSSNWEFVRVS